MLKAVALLVLLANLLFFGFTHGWFDGLFGLRSIGDREPERLAHQVNADRIVVLPRSRSAAAAAAARSADESNTASPPGSTPGSTNASIAGSNTGSTGSAGPGTCLQAGPIASMDAAAAEATLRSVLPQGGWVDVRAGSLNNDSAGSHLYRVDAADAATAEKLRSLRLDELGRGFSACASAGSEAGR